MNQTLKRLIAALLGPAKVRDLARTLCIAEDTIKGHAMTLEEEGQIIIFTGHASWVLALREHIILTSFNRCGKLILVDGDNPAAIGQQALCETLRL